MSDEVVALVVDNGSGMCKAGLVTIRAARFFFCYQPPSPSKLPAGRVLWRRRSANSLSFHHRAPEDAGHHGRDGLEPCQLRRTMSRVGMPV